jgi:hypothetical protein
MLRVDWIDFEDSVHVKARGEMIFSFPRWEVIEGIPSLSSHGFPPSEIMLLQGCTVSSLFLPPHLLRQRLSPLIEMIRASSKSPEVMLCHLQTIPAPHGRFQLVEGFQQAPCNLVATADSNLTIASLNGPDRAVDSIFTFTTLVAALRSSHSRISAIVKATAGYGCGGGADFSSSLLVIQDPSLLLSRDTAPKNVLLTLVSRAEASFVSYPQFQVFALVNVLKKVQGDTVVLVCDKESRVVPQAVRKKVFLV